MYREQAKVETYPKEETAAEKEARVKREIEVAETSVRRWNMLGIFVIFMIPSAFCSALGICWNMLSSAMASTFSISAALISLGAGIAIGFGLGWDK